MRLSKLAVRLLAARAAFKSLSDWTLPDPEPKVMLVAVPPPVEAMVRVSPVLILMPSTRLPDVPARTEEVTVDLVE